MFSINIAIVSYTSRIPDMGLILVLYAYVLHVPDASSFYRM